MIGLASLTALFSIVLAIRSYSPCPFWDQWEVIYDLAQGRKPWSWPWLWSQHNEHRIVIPRLLIGLDLAWFGGRNVFLYCLLFAVQFCHWAVFSYLIESERALQTGARRFLQGFLGICLFHPNQLENFAWPFQVGFLLPFLLATMAFAAIAVRKPQWTRTNLCFLALAPLLAGMNLSGGLLLGAFVLLLAVERKRQWSVIAALATIYLVWGALYLHGYVSPGGAASPLSYLGHPHEIYRYVLSYFGHSFELALERRGRLLAWFAIAGVLVFAARSMFRRGRSTPLEAVLTIECLFVVSFAALTSLARLGNGAGQSTAGRYQTPAMIFWGCAFSLLFLQLSKITVNRTIPFATLFIALGLLVPGVPYEWRMNESHVLSYGAACRSAFSPSPDPALTSRICPVQNWLLPGVHYLRQIWQPRTNSR